MAFEKLKKPTQTYTPQAAPLSAPAAPATSGSPTAADLLMGKVKNAAVDTAITAGTDAILGAAASNPVTAPLAAGGLALKKVMGK